MQAHRPFIPYPNPILKTPAREVNEITGEITALWDEMIEAMDSMPGVGLAAPQLGVALRLAVVDASEKRGKAIRMANPSIVHASIELREHDEASPNLPGVSATIARPRAVTVRYLAKDGVYKNKDLVGLWATSVQHQIDHLNGKMYFDHLSRTKRAMLLKRANKLKA